MFSRQRKQDFHLPDASGWSFQLAPDRTALDPREETQFLGGVGRGGLGGRTAEHCPDSSPEKPSKAKAWHPLCQNHLGERTGEPWAQGKESISEPYLLGNCKSSEVVMRECPPGHPGTWMCVTEWLSLACEEPWRWGLSMLYLSLPASSFIPGAGMWGSGDKYTLSKG